MYNDIVIRQVFDFFYTRVIIKNKKLYIENMYLIGNSLKNFFKNKIYYFLKKCLKMCIFGFIQSKN